MKGILVIDGNQGFCELISTLCGDLGLKATCFLSFEKAIAEISLGDYDCIFMELDLQGIDGPQAIGIMTGMCLNVPVILMSGEHASILSTAQYAGKMRGLNIVSTIAKPFSVDELSSLIQDAADRQQQLEGQQPAAPREKVENLRPGEVIRLVEAGHLQCVFQPQIDLNTRNVCGVEVLARIDHPEQGVITPDRFVNELENCSLIEVFNEYLFNHSFKAYKAFGRPDLTISINISAYCIRNELFPDFISTLAKQYDISPSKVILEITESHGLNFSAQSLMIMSRVRIKGFSLSIDDFGTGYSSLETFSKVPFNELKVDREFTSRLRAEERAKKIFELAINLSKQMGIVSVAEGIEDEEEASLVAAIGCDVGQGYYFGRPMPSEKFMEWLNWELKEAPWKQVSI